MSVQGMQTQVIARMIVDAMIHDEKPEAGGFDLSAGLFGPALSEVIRQLAGEQLDLQRQLAEVTRERDTLKAMVDLHDAMNDRRRAAQETTFKRRTYENG